MSATGAINTSATMPSRCGEFAQAAFQQQLCKAQALLADINAENPENLHQFRVCLRRIRAYLSLLKHTLHGEVLTRLKHECTRIAKTTNHLRDLDVWLQGQPQHLQLLPPPLHTHFPVFIRLLETQRQQQLELVLTQREHLDAQLNALQQSLSAGKLESCTDNTLKTARKVFRKQQVKVLERVRRLDHHSADSEFHKLRIEMKKLRYGLDLFLPLCDDKSYRQLLKRLKGMQDSLGNFNDVCVQQGFLSAFIQPESQPQLVHQDQSAILVVSAGLLGALYTHQQQSKTQIVNQTHKFSRELSTLKATSLYPDKTPA